VLYNFGLGLTTGIEYDWFRKYSRHLRNQSDAKPSRLLTLA